MYMVENLDQIHSFSLTINQFLLVCWNRVVVFTIIFFGHLSHIFQDFCELDNIGI